LLIPQFLENGFLPAGLYSADRIEVEKRFGKNTPQRRKLFERLKLFVEMARHCGALKLLINGSFVTAKGDPNDVDVVIR
jgi:hypothetical protein